MDTAADIALAIHIAAGFVGVVAFFIPVATAKGQRTHRAAGWIFSLAMLTAATTGAALSANTLLQGPQNARPFAWFLLYIAALTAFGALHGLRMLRFQDRKGPHPSTLDFILPTALLLGGPALIVYGILIPNTLLATFPIIGVVLGGVTLCYLMRDDPHRVHWKTEHMTGMFTAGISSITAFLVTGAASAAREIPTLGPAAANALESPLAWFLPSAVLVPILSIMIAREKRRAAKPLGVTAEPKPATARTLEHAKR